jgi:hypothetical protein
VNNSNEALQKLITHIITYQLRILLLIDNCRKFIEENFDYFNKAIEKLSRSNSNIKIIVITDNREDIIE